MNTIIKRTLSQSLYYKNSVILKYTINYPEIISSPFETKFFNKYSKLKNKNLQNKRTRNTKG